jgi:hypothetical protein
MEGLQKTYAWVSQQVENAKTKTAEMAGALA